MHKTPKVVIISNLFPNPVDNTRGIFTYQLARWLKEICDVHVICPLPYFPKTRLFRSYKKWHALSLVPQRYVIGNISVTSPKYLMIPRVSEFTHALLFYCSVLRTLKALKQKGQVDIVNAHWLYPDGVAATWACHVLHIPIILTALGSDVNLLSQMPVVSSQIRRALKDSDLVTAVSRDLAAKIERLGVATDRIKTVHNGVDPSLFQILDKGCCRSSLHLPLDANLVLFLGRLSSEKGFETLIQAAGIAKERYKKVRVVAVGDGPLRQRYEGMVKSSGLCACFEFKGNVEHSIVPKWLGAADLLCLPSLNEGCPNVVLEALCSGRPVVGSRVGGIPELVKNGRNGFIFEAGDVQGLATCIDRALSTEWNPHGIRDSVAHRTWEQVARRYKEFYVGVLSNHAPPTAHFCN